MPGGPSGTCRAIATEPAPEVLRKAFDNWKTRRALKRTGYLVRLRWREECVYIEDGHDECLVFDCPMGTESFRVHVPTEAKWARLAPDWAKDRRQTVVERIAGLERVAEVVSSDGAGIVVEERR